MDFMINRLNERINERPISSALSCIGNYVLPAAATTLYQEQELSSVIELSQLLDQSSGTPSLNPSDQSTT